MKIKCKHCESFLGNIETGIVEIYCKNCGSTNQIIVLDNEASIKPANKGYVDERVPDYSTSEVDTWATVNLNNKLL